MSKYHRIRWTQNDQNELTRVVRNFNNKINRLTKKNPELKNALPDKVTVKQLKELINTRQDLKRELNSLTRFSRRGSEEIVTIPDNEYNLKITKWQRNEINRRVAVVNRKRKKRLDELENLEVTSRGEGLGYTVGQIGMGKIQELSLRPVTGFRKTMNRTDLKYKWLSLLNESQSDFFTKRDFMCRDNYLKGLKENYDWNSIKDIYAHIESMDINEFLVIFNREGSTFEYASPDSRLDLKHDEYKGYETALRSVWLPNKE